MKQVSILYHPRRPEARELAEELGRLLAPARSVWLGSAWEEEAARERIASTDLVISIGGDGTILRTARAVAPLPIPILGVNLGTLGFMAELSPAEARAHLPALLDGEGWIEERTMLEARFLSST